MNIILELYKKFIRDIIIVINFVVCPRKPEMIIRENQPKELPPDVARGKAIIIEWVNSLKSN